ncbi:hypothetical protein [Falsiruegeria litorea]|nr:hypothetical protein [Falsiruegeria litorea]
MPQSTAKVRNPPEVLEWHVCIGLETVTNRISHGRRLWFESAS